MQENNEISLQNIQRGISRDIMPNMLDCQIIVRGFELQSRY